MNFRRFTFTVWALSLALATSLHSQDFQHHNLNNSDKLSWLAIPHDVDRDGNMDIVSNNDDEIMWYQNMGTFWLPMVPSLPGDWPIIRNPRDIDIADFDNNGIDDILICTVDPGQSGKLIWTTGDSFMQGPANVIDDNKGFLQAVTGDFNKDGLTDVIAVALLGDTLLMYLNHASGSFSKHALATNVPNASVIEADDLDMDGDLDLVTGGSNSPNGGSAVFWNDGQANFSLGNDLYGIYAAREDIMIHDIDKDGVKDILFFEATGPSPDLYRKTVDSLHEDAHLFAEGVHGGGFLTDLNQDGWEDLLAFNKNTMTLYSYLNDWPDIAQFNDTMMYMDVQKLSMVKGHGYPGGNLLFSGRRNNFTDAILGWSWAGTGTIIGQANEIRFNGIAHRPTKLQSVLNVDIDKDGDIDILALASGSIIQKKRDDEHILGFRNDGTGNFLPITIPIEADRPLKGLWDLVAIDIDGDTDIDLAGTAKYSETVFWLENEDPWSKWVFHLVKDSVGQVENLAVDDVNNDGNMDMVFCLPDEGKLFYRPNITNPSVFSQLIPNGLSNPFKTLFVDFDKDGDLDIASIGSSGLDGVCIDWFTGVKFENPMLLGPYTIPSDIEVVELNGDSWPDLLVSYFLDDPAPTEPVDIVAFINNQQGGFSQRVVLRENAKVTNISIDQNPDGSHLVYFSTQKNGQASVRKGLLPNPLNGNLMEISDVSDHELHIITDLESSDLDGDGLPDVVYSDQSIEGVMASFPDSLPTLTSINSGLPIRSLTVYPNPVQDVLGIDLEGEMIERIQVINLKGQVVLEQTMAMSSSLSVKELNQGSYFLKVFTPMHLYVARFVRVE
ncbi:MAG: T9SS type A sorting domain-containing protein [Bacteroidota bacterium]